MKKSLLSFFLSLIIANVLQAQDDIMIRQFPDNPFLKEVQQRIDNKEGSRLSSPTIIFGDIFTFKYGSAGFTSSAALSANKFVVAFTDDGDNEAGKIVLGIISNNTVNFYSETEFFPSKPGHHYSIIALDENRFVISWCEGNFWWSTDDAVKSRVGVVNDTVITLGPIEQIDNGQTSRISTARIDSTHFVLVSKVSSKGKAILAEVNSDTITYGQPVIFNETSGASAYYVAALDSSRFVIVYNDGGYFSDPGKAIIGNINGNVLSFGNEFTFCNENLAAYFKVCNLDTNSFAINYPSEYGPPTVGKAIIGTTNGNVIEYGDTAHFGYVIDWHASPLRLDKDHFLVTAHDNSQGYARVGTVIDDSISYSGLFPFYSGYCEWISSDMLDEHNFFISFSNFYGKVILGSYYDKIETFIDSSDVCAGSFIIPLQARYIYNALESFIQISYDTLTLSYTGFQNFSNNIPTDTMSVVEDNGVIKIYWHAQSTVNLESDVLLELLFNSDDSVSFNNTVVDLNDTISYYKDNTGVLLNSVYFDGYIEEIPLPDTAVFIAGTDSVCQGTSMVLYQIGPIENADSVIWGLTPDSTGTIIGSDTIIYINFSPGFYGQASLSACGINDCGMGEQDFYSITVIEGPVAEAGPNTTICEDTSQLLNGSAQNYTMITWTTDGDGTFDNEFILNATYSPGPVDIANGSVLLRLNAFAEEPCIAPAIDSLLLNIIKLPEEPHLPMGPNFISLDSTTNSEYFTFAVNNVNGYYWHLDPDEAGSISGIDTIGTVLWNPGYTGISAFIYVEAFNDCGAVPSDSLLISIVPVKIEYNAVDPGIVIAPNPSKGIFTITIGSTEDDMQLSVINSIGETIYSKKIFKSVSSQSFQIELTGELPGVYYLLLSGESNLVVRRIIRIK